MTAPPRQAWIAPLFVAAWISASSCTAIPLIGMMSAGAMAGGWMPLPSIDADPLEIFPLGVLAALTALQFAAMLLPAVILALLLPGAPTLAERAAASFPLRIGPPGYLLAAAVLGATVG